MSAASFTSASVTRFAFSHSRYGSPPRGRLDLLIRDDPPLRHVPRNKSAPAAAAPERDPLRGMAAPPPRSHDHEMSSSRSSAKAAAVPIERRADIFPSVNRDRRRPIPRLHEARVIFVKRLLIVTHRLVQPHGSGIIIIIACGSERRPSPAARRHYRTSPSPSHSRSRSAGSS